MTVSNVEKTDGESNRAAQDMLHGKIKHKQIRTQDFPKLNPQAYGEWGAMRYKGITGRPQPLFVFNETTALRLCIRFNMLVQLHFSNFLYKPS